MKRLFDGNEVAARTYYYLLDYMDRRFDQQPLWHHCQKDRLMDTTISEYLSFFKKAVDEDIENLNKLIK